MFVLCHYTSFPCWGQLFYCENPWVRWNLGNMLTFALSQSLCHL